jgi:hypothetical protein
MWIHPKSPELLRWRHWFPFVRVCAIITLRRFALLVCVISLSMLRKCQDFEGETHIWDVDGIKACNILPNFLTECALGEWWYLADIPTSKSKDCPGGLRVTSAPLQVGNATVMFKH